MTEEERIPLIRRGNELFNQGDHKNALKIFLATNYKDGIIRVADLLYFDQNDKVSAVKLYKKAGHTKVLNDFVEKAAQVVRLYLLEDKQKESLKEEMKAKIIQEWKPIVIKADDIEQISENKAKNEDNHDKSGRKRSSDGAPRKD